MSIAPDDPALTVATENDLTLVANHLPQLAWMADATGLVFWYSQRWYDYTGTTLEQMRGWGWRDVHHPDHVDRVVKKISHCFATGEDWEDTFPLRATDGSYRWFLSRARPIRDAGGRIMRWYGSNTDVTEQRIVDAALRASETTIRELNHGLELRVTERTAELERSRDLLLQQIAQREQAEEQIRQMQKNEAIGQLTGGIAHDFNNMLAVIVGSLNLAERRLTRGEPAGAMLANALDAANRAAALTNRLLAFARQLPLAPEPIDANRMIASMSDMLRRTLGEATRLETVLAGGLWTINADLSQLENVLLNLGINARDAMPDGGRLTVETANCSLDDAYARAHAEVAPGQYVLIAVSDTGIGMTPEIIARAMEPYFTTKPVGRGTGLGLSQVYGFVKQSRGHVKIYSEPGQGTSVKIYLPRHYETAGTGRAATAVMDATIPIGSLSDIILVVEDDARVREMTTTTLRELGYSVLQAPSGDVALTLLAAHPEIDLLFTDVVMPDMNGRQLADRAAALRPDLRVLFTTGYTRNAVVHNGVLDAGVNLLTKPFSLEQLARKLRDVLAGT